MEWANDSVLEYSYHLLKNVDVPATIFVTHKTKWLEIFRNDPQIELGIHPNFNKLLLGESNGTNYKKIFDDLMRIVPGAVSYRSHSLTASSLFIAYAAQKGLKIDLNTYICPSRGDCITPYRRSGMLIVPFIFEDDLWLADTSKKHMSYYLSDEFDALRIFNFHPIQLYLNCESIERYEKAKVHNWNQAKLETYRNKDGCGIETVFLELIQKIKQMKLKMGLVKELEAPKWR